jgi:hypothetical protein
MALDTPASLGRMQRSRSVVRTGVVGILGGLLAGVGAHFAYDGNSSAKRQSQPSANNLGASASGQLQSHYGAIDLDVAYGSTPRQVLGQLGPPTTKDANCWLYRGRGDTIRGRYSGGSDVMKFCFSAGPIGNTVVTNVFQHTPAHTIVKRDPQTGKVTRKHFRAAWGPTVTLLKVPDWYLQQNS